MLLDHASERHTTEVQICASSTASIARKNSLAILHPSSRCSLSAVASRSASRAADFVQRFGASSGSVAYGSYEDLIADPDIDAIYVPLPTYLHLENVTLALRAGKHVLVEKPISVSLQGMIDAASLTRKVIMDGTMFVHEPVRLPSFLKVCTTDIGKVDRIESEFSFHGGKAFESSNIRMRADGDPLGCVGDMAWYSIRATIVVYGRRDAHSDSGHGDAGDPLQKRRWRPTSKRTRTASPSMFLPLCTLRGIAPSIFTVDFDTPCANLCAL